MDRWRKHNQIILGGLAHPLCFYLEYVEKTISSGKYSHPASEQMISSVEIELGLPLTNQLRSLYLVCDGFREDKGNAKYLLSLRAEDQIGSLISTTQYMWSLNNGPIFKDYIFFGYSGADEVWGNNIGKNNQIIAYHHHMENEFQLVGDNILSVYQADYEKYSSME